MIQVKKYGGKQARQVNCVLLVLAMFTLPVSAWQQDDSQTQQASNKAY
jgi:hypothetical protein